MIKRPLSEVTLTDPYVTRGRRLEEALTGGGPSHPGAFLAPPNAQIQPPAQIRSSSERPKTSNSLIPYARVVPVSYLEKIGTRESRQEKKLVFVSHVEGVGPSSGATRSMVVAGSAPCMVAMHGLESLNAAFEANTQKKDATDLALSWRLDGVLLSPPEENGDRGSLNVNVGIYGPCVVHNTFSARPLVWDICFVGLFYDERGACSFTSPRLRYRHTRRQLRQPTAPQLGKMKHRLLPDSVINPVKDEDMRRLVGATT